MSERTMGNLMTVLFIFVALLLIGVCIYNGITAKKKERAVAPYVLLPIGLGVIIFLGFTPLWISWDLSFRNYDYVMSFLTFFLILCGYAFSVLVARRALNKEDKRKKILSRSLKPEHFTNGRSFSPAAFEDWIFESRRCAKKALTAYICSACGGFLLSFLFAQGAEGAVGYIMAGLCAIAGPILGGVLSRKAGRSAENAAAYLGISDIEVTTARRNLKNGALAWSDEEKKPAVDTEARVAKAEAGTEVPPEATEDKPTQWQGKRRRPRGKMKKWLKITLIAAAGVIFLFLCLVVISIIDNNIHDDNETAFRQCLYACDTEGAQEYANKLTRKSDTIYQDMLDRMERFIALYDAGSWQEAIAEYDGNGRFADYGIALAKYCECYYQILIPPAETALDEGRIRDAMELLLQFQNRFDWISIYDFETKTHFGDFEEYSACYEDHGQHFLDLTARAAEAAMAAGDGDVISLLEGFNDKYVKTVPFEEFSWSEEYLAWKAAQ
jgi:hypothetical protein